MSIFSQQPWSLEFLVTEAPGYISRDDIVIAAGSGVVKAGTVLGKHTVSGKYKPAVAPAVAASGSVAFTANPTASSTIVIGGTTVTFVASGATGNQVNIGASLAATLTALLAFLQGSADTNLVKFSYYLSGSTLNLIAKTAGAAGNSLTLSTTVTGATASGATLAGGSDAGASDGTQTAVAITGFQVDATNADVTVASLMRTCEVTGVHLTRDATTAASAAITAAQNAQLAAAGIMVR
ncbi:hypothetical protein LMIY3S_03689 [Labrys miyagiensis]